MGVRCLALALLIGVAGCKDPEHATQIEVLEAVAYPSPENPDSAAIVVVSLRNDGVPSGLVGGRVAGARVRLRTHAFEDERPITPVLAELQLPPGREVRMNPLGVFLSITELKAPPRPGGSIDLFLVFPDRSELPATAQIRAWPNPASARTPPGDAR